MPSPSDRLTAALADRYRIERELGQGGMATVYLAQDLKHDRKVALKVLKPELAAVLGADRFVVEIKTTASLQHPHILPLFDSGTADGFLYYVMPFIEGETLRDQLNRETQLGVDEAVRIAIDVADALHYAHAQGVIHRDIKPENILLANGRPMVADFGIALAVSAAAGGRMTETGLSLGTPHYMSPEQATADKEITGRSDVYSLASVLYEMLAGQPPHLGGSAQQIIMKIIAEAPQNVSALRKTVPPNVAAAVARALEKLPADRFQSAQAFADALKNTAFAVQSMAGGAVAVSAEPWKQRAAIPLTVAATVFLVVAAWGWLRPKAALSVSRFDLDPGVATPTPGSDIVISPDGSLLAFAGVVRNEPTALYVRRLNGDPDFRKVPGTDGANSASPTFSPDSRSLAFRRLNNALVRLDLSGAGATVISDLGTEIGTYLHWGTPDQIVYSGGPQGLFRVAAAGGTPEFLRKAAGAQRHSFLLPDGSGVLFSLNEGVLVLDFRTDSATLLVPNAIHPTYVATGHLLYIAQEGGLFAIPFDLGSHRISGTAVRLLDRVAAGTGQRGYSVSQHGTLVYHEGASSFTGDASIPNALAIVDVAGTVRRLELPASTRSMPRFSPTGDRIVFAQAMRGGRARDIHVFDIASGTDTRLTFDGDNLNPIWSPDGRQILFTRSSVVGDDRRDLFVKPADNSSAEQSVLAMPGQQSPDSWLKDGTILFSSAAQGGLFKLFAVKDSGEPTAFLDGPMYERAISLSPDGRYAVYESSNQGEVSVWIADYPAARGRWQVAPMAGVAPRWSRDGYVYFWKTASATMDSLFRARVDLSPTVVVRTAEFVLALPISQTTRNWDLHPDGKRFVTSIREAPNTSQGDAPTTRYVVALNWFEELKRLMERQ
jgi:Tol biopolymer transport system component/tRNA A-37 threonylcarbamoyl transferase component Bud32